MNLEESKSMTIQLIDEFHESNLVCEKQEIFKKILKHLTDFNTLDDSMINSTIRIVFKGHIDAYRLRKIKIDKESIIGLIDRFYENQMLK